MTPPQWIRNIVEEEMGNHLEIDKCFIHPVDGPIKIIGGRFWGDVGLSNHWTWEVLATGERNNGYGGDWKPYTE